MGWGLCLPSAAQCDGGGAPEEAPHGDWSEPKYGEGARLRYARLSPHCVRMVPTPVFLP